MVVATVILTSTSFPLLVPISILFAFLRNLLLLTVLMRCGLLAFVVAGFALQSSIDFPLIADTSRWWTGYGYAAFAIILGIALSGFKTALAGGPVFEVAH